LSPGRWDKVRDRSACSEVIRSRGCGSRRVRLSGVYFFRFADYDLAVSSTLVSVSVDLDALACYHRIHALGDGPSSEARFAILRRALPRLAELFARHGIAATLFTVGHDLEDDAEGRQILADLAKAGHEIASHTYSHPYNLVRLGRDKIADELDRAHAAIAEACGCPPIGFRAPGYEITAELIDLLCERGYRYDASAFPAIPYYLAKAGCHGRLAHDRSQVEQHPRQSKGVGRAVLSLPPRGFCALPSRKSSHHRAACDRDAVSASARHRHDACHFARMAASQAWCLRP
jgi:hypothetical protein